MNSFFGLGPMELFLIVFIALIVLGPQRLPGTIREVMKYWRYFRNLSGELTSQLGEEFKDLEDLNPQKMLEGFANELDDEVEKTQKAAGVKKTTKTTKTTKSSTKKTTTAKSATSSSTSTVKKPTTTTTSSTSSTASSTSKTDGSATGDATGDAKADVEPLKRGESLVDEAATIAEGAAAGVAAGASSDSSNDASNGDGGSKAATTPKKAESSDKPLADLEYSIMKPSSKKADKSDGKPANEASPKSTSEQVATDTKSTADTAKTSVNGAANKSEDEG